MAENYKEENRLDLKLKACRSFRFGATPRNGQSLFLHLKLLVQEEPKLYRKFLAYLQKNGQRQRLKILMKKILRRILRIALNSQAKGCR